MKVELIPQWRLPDLAYTTQLSSILTDLRIERVIDVGANRGQFRDLLRSNIGFAGEIHSFEPDPELFEALQQRATRDPKWTVHPVALGAAAERKPFHVMQNPLFNSFFEPSEHVPEFSRHGNEVRKIVAVEVKTLDSVASAFPDLDRTYVKLDAQGFSQEIVKGAADVLSRVPALQTEIAVQKLYNGGSLMTEDLHVFRKLGFVASNFFIVAQDNAHRAIEFDCLMVRG